MFQRNILASLLEWKTSTSRKPLILRGARQVGKTTVINQLGREYKQYIYLNLEKKSEADLFKHYSSINELVAAIFFLKDANIALQSETLLFIDEIQEVPKAINQLRYFYEEHPQIHVVAAGSLLETILGQETNFPVGRVEFKVLQPFSFTEFLRAIGETQSLQLIADSPTPDYAHDKILKLFNTYTLIGGMPEIVRLYVTEKNLLKLSATYDSLIFAYQNDFEKYAKNASQTTILRHILSTLGTEIGNRIKFHHFGNSNYGSREMGEALRTLERAMLIKLVYPTISAKYPLQNDLKKSPRLHFLDTGLFNKMAGIQKELVKNVQIENTFQGKVAEHIVGQELITLNFSVSNTLRFWTKENKDSNAEVDYLYEHDGLLIPIEVKSGSAGRLRSLHSFIDDAPHCLGVRISSNQFLVEETKTIAGKPFRLINLPFYMVSSIGNVVNKYM